MPIQTRRYVMLLGAVCLAIVAVGYHFFILAPAYKPLCVSGAFSKQKSASSLLDLQLPSVIPNLHIAAKRRRVHQIDLRRADLVMAITEDEPAHTIKPLMDKVLVVPKAFVRQHHHPAQHASKTARSKAIL